MNKQQSYSNIVVQLRGGSEYLETIELTDIEDSVLARINELAVKYLVEQENQVPSGVTIQ